MGFEKERLICKKISNDLDLSNFDCGDSDLNEFLVDDALIQMNSKINITRVCLYDSRIMGFFTLSADSIPINKSDKRKLKIMYPQFPALKIGRLAVDKKYQKKGMGTEIIKRIIGCGLKLSRDYIGLRFISVDAYPNSIKFYEKNYFKKLKKVENKHSHLETRLLRHVDILLQKICRKSKNMHIQMYLDLEN